LQRTGGLITAAALLLGVVTAGFASGQLVIAKLIGVGMVSGLALDAVLVRMILVPATMRLLGRWNWWLPAPLAAVYRRLGLQESSVPVGGVAALDGDLVGDVLRVVPSAPDEAGPAAR
jgi:RND superfamily putative drug exporter